MTFSVLRRALCCGLFFLCSLGAISAEQIVEPNEKDVIDLHNYQWELYWKKFIAPSEFADGTAPQADAIMQPLTIWNGRKLKNETAPSFGFATYRIKLKIQGRHERLAVRLIAPLTSYRLYINGEKMSQIGVPSESPAGFVAQRRSSLVFFSPQGADLEIIVHVANFLHNKGGLRGGFFLGRAEVIQAYAMRYLAIDLFAIGLIFAIMLYHLLVFILTRKDISILVFAVLAFDYFLLAFTFGEQAISLFLPNLPLDTHLKFGAFCIYILPPLILHFTTLLFPGILPRFVLWLYWAIALIMAAFLILPPVFFTSYNVFYYGCVGLSVGILSLWIAIRAYRDKRAGAVLFALGLLFLVSLTVYAIYLFTSHSQAGSFLSIGFCLFALFQSASLAYNHSVLDRINGEMQDRLERSRFALENQRKQIEANLHDSLGGNLTDIKLSIEELVRQHRAAGLQADLIRLDHRVAGTITSLRTELLFLEDLELVMKDFISGINLILLRRYQMVKREVNIQITSASRDCGRWLEGRGLLNEQNKLELCMIVQELCNNSLKHGKGSAVWNIEAEPQKLAIRFQGRTVKKASKLGLGQETLRERAHKIEAEYAAQLKNGAYSAELVLKFP